MSGRNIYNRGLIQVDGGNRGAGGGRVVMAARDTIERGVLSIGDGSFAEIKPPAIQTPETIYLSYQAAHSVEKRKSVSTRPNNLKAYWAMDEGQGLVVSDELKSFPGNLVGGVTWTDGKFGGGLSFNGTDSYVVTEAFGEDLSLIHI